jgi:plasmid maintenance system antidote protein VapI
MNIKEYLGSMNITVNDFSHALDVHPTYLSNIIHGRYIPGPKLSKNIFLLTKGKVKLKTKKDLARQHAKNSVNDEENQQQ